MSAELVGILSVGATLLVGGLATAGAVVGLMFRLDGRQSARMDAMEERLGARMDDMERRQSARMDRMDSRMDRMGARMDRMDARMDTVEARQYEIAQTVARLEASQQAMLATLSRIEEHTRPTDGPSVQPADVGTGVTPADDVRRSAAVSTSSPT